MRDYSFHSFTVMGEELNAMGKWKYLALHHELTALPNRRMFDMSIEAHMKQARSQQDTLAIALLHIDRLQELNTRFGYSEGDAFLVELSARMAALSEEHMQAFHFGGTSFAVLIKEAQNLPGKMNVLQSIFQQPFLIQKTPVFMEASMGVCVYPEHLVDPAEWLSFAGKALSQAKTSTNKKCWIFGEEGEHKKD